MKIVKHIVILLLFAPLLTFGQAWMRIPDFPGEERDDGVAVAVGNKAYFGTSGSNSDFYSLDLPTSTWTTIPGMPQGLERQYACAFPGNNCFYVVGGYGNGVTLNDLLKYDIASATWSIMPAIPDSGFSGAVCFYFGNKIIIAGGKFQHDYISEHVWEYDLTLNSWTRKNDMPFGGRWRGAGTVLNNKGYLIFGRDGNLFWRPELFEYNPVSDNWIKVSDFPAPTARIYSAMQASGNYLAVVGGWDSTNIFHNDTWFYHSSGAWEKGPDIPAAGRRGGMSCAANNILYYSCGLTTGENRIKETWLMDMPLALPKSQASDLKIFPNPASDELWVLDNDLISSYTIEDGYGRILLSGYVSEKPIDVNKLTTGLYFLRICNNKKTSVFKIVKSE